MYESDAMVFRKKENLENLGLICLMGMRKQMNSWCKLESVLI